MQPAAQIAHEGLVGVGFGAAQAVVEVGDQQPPRPEAAARPSPAASRRCRPADTANKTVTSPQAMGARRRRFAARPSAWIQL